ncbi:MAG: hypothetical protein QM765_00720 [Myxococcales bacterium]
MAQAMFCASSKRALSLDEHGHLLAGERRPLQRRDDRRVGAGAVQRLLDGQHVRVVGGGLDELHHRPEGLVGQVDDDVLLADGVPQRRRAVEGRDRLRLEGLVVQALAVQARGELHERLEVERPVDLVEVADRVEPQLLAQPAGHLRRGVGLELQAQRVALLASPQHVLHRLEQVADLLVVHGEVGVARDAEEGGLLDLVAREEALQVVPDDVLDQQVAVAAVGGQEEEPRPGAGQGQHGPALRLAAGALGLEPHREVDGEAGDLQPLAAAVVLDRHRRQRREELVGEVALDDGLVLALQRLGAHPADVSAAERGQHVLLQAAVELGHHRPRAPGDLRELLGGRHPRGAAPVRLVLERAEQLADAHHEELVQVGADDGQERQALQERVLEVERLLQHAVVEGEPGEARG